MEEWEELYKVWASSRGEEGRFVTGWLYWSTPLFHPTLEGLTAFKAYRSLPRDEGLEYAVFSSHLYDVFFSLSQEQLDFVERNLPPYPHIVEEIWRGRGLDAQEREVLGRRVPRNPLRAIRLVREKEEIVRRHGLIPEEYQSILDRQREADWRSTRRLLALFYAAVSLEIFLSTLNPAAPLVYLLTFPLPYQGLRYLSSRIPSRRVRSYVDKASLVYLLARSPAGLLLSTVEFGLVAPLLSRLVEKYWFSSVFPDPARRLVYEAQARVSGLKPRSFDEREVRELLSSIKVDSPSIPRTAVERFLEEVEDGLVEVEDPRRALLHPFSLSWYRRSVVAVLEGGEVRIVDKEFIRKLALKEGVFLEELEKRVRACPTRYLGVDVWKGKVVFTRDVIGLLPCQIARALAYKEGYTAILGKKADEILERELVHFPLSRLKDLVRQNWLGARLTREE